MRKGLDVILPILARREAVATMKRNRGSRFLLYSNYMYYLEISNVKVMLRNKGQMNNTWNSFWYDQTWDLPDGVYKLM